MWFYKKYQYFLVVASISIIGCKHNISDPQIITKPIDSIQVDKLSKKQIPKGWVALTTDNGVLLDIKYATQDNFTKEVIYPCGACYLREPMAKAMQMVNSTLLDKYGYRLKFFDCYRPSPAQQKLWDIVPDPRYVTNPAKGSMHNRGMAVDVTIVDSEGNDLDMGTAYDYFGEEAHYDYMDHDETVIQNRRLLRAIMEDFNCTGIRTEWWHFSMKSPTYEVSSWEWPCDE